MLFRAGPAAALGPSPGRNADRPPRAPCAAALSVSRSASSCADPRRPERSIDGRRALAGRSRAKFLGALGVGGDYFYTSLIQHVALGDFMSGLGKSVFFGYLIGIISCFKGLTAHGVADGVGRATTSAVVAASISVLISDFFLTKLFLAI